MRHFYLTVSGSAVLLLAACSEASKSESIVMPSSEAAVAESKLDGGNAALTESADRTEAPEMADEEVSDTIDDSDLPEKYQGLNPDDISRAEIDELIKLRKSSLEQSRRFRKEKDDWLKQNTVTRGPMPTWSDFSLSKEETDRKRVLNFKFATASKKKKYEGYGPDVLSTAEVDELVSLEHKQSMARKKIRESYQKRLKNWRKQDPAIRGERPSQKGIYRGLSDPRLFELRSKTQSVDKLNRLKTRVAKLDPVHNFNLLDSDITEWAELQQETLKLQVEFYNAINAAKDDRQFDEAMDINDSEFIERIFTDVIPKYKTRRMFEIKNQMDAIEAPLKAAEIADRTRKNMSRESDRAGVSISSREIRETIDLKVELDRIKKRIEFEAQEKWLEDGGSLPDGYAEPNAEDSARIKEINARIKEISAPIDETLMELK